MKNGSGKVLPGPCTLAEEADAAIENIERQFPAEAGLIGRMSDWIEKLQKAIEDMDTTADEAACSFRRIVSELKIEEP